MLNSVLHTTETLDKSAQSLNIFVAQAAGPCQQCWKGSPDPFHASLVKFQTTLGYLFVTWPPLTPTQTVLWCRDWSTGSPTTCRAQGLNPWLHLPGQSEMSKDTNSIFICISRSEPTSLCALLRFSCCSRLMDSVKLLHHSDYMGLFRCTDPILGTEN